MDSILGVAWGNILVGLLSGALVAGFGRIRKLIINWRIEKKYPIAGNYLTKFEDEKEGLRIVQSASATLKQVGKKIIGETTLLDDNRIWKIEGQITELGYLHGIYYCSDPHDKGIGNFFLNINHQRHMEGIWAGYDSINKKITTGRYIFSPMTNVLIKDATENDIPAILAIAEVELGKDYLSESLLGDFESSKDKYVFQIACCNKEIAGFCISIITDKDEVKTYLKTEKLNRVFGHSKKVGIIKTIAVKKTMKGRGIGTELIKNTLNTLETKHGIRSFCSIGWKNAGKINIEGILKRFDFSFFEEIKEYWAEDSIKNEYDCPFCGSPPCKCSAVIYTKSI